MLELLQRLFGRDHQSAQVAKERLRLVLVHDRSTVSPQFLDVLKEDLIKVISTYMDIDEQGMEVTLSSEGSQVALVANIPVKRIKRAAMGR